MIGSVPLPLGHGPLFEAIVLGCRGVFCLAGWGCAPPKEARGIAEDRAHQDEHDGQGKGQGEVTGLLENFDQAGRHAVGAGRIEQSGGRGPLDRSADLLHDRGHRARLCLRDRGFAPSHLPSQPSRFDEAVRTSLEVTLQLIEELVGHRLACHVTLELGESQLTLQVVNLRM
jgi:hypothetical protein